MQVTVRYEYLTHRTSWLPDCGGEHFGQGFEPAFAQDFLDYSMPPAGAFA